ncbi:MAG: hypothetical protein ACTSRH_15425, partial [Promethearchaeota archaeon]
TRNSTKKINEDAQKQEINTEKEAVESKEGQKDYSSAVEPHLAREEKELIEADEKTRNKIEKVSEQEYENEAEVKASMNSANKSEEIGSHDNEADNARYKTQAKEVKDEKDKGSQTSNAWTLEKFKEMYKKETNKSPEKNNKLTRDFIFWRKLKIHEIVKKEEEELLDELKKELENIDEWEKVLRKWIKEATEDELSKESKKTLSLAFFNYRQIERLLKKLGELLYKYYFENPSIKLLIEINEVMSKLREFGHLGLILHEKIYVFKNFYEENSTWYEDDIKAERSKFLKHLEKIISEENKKNKSNMNEKSGKTSLRARRIILKALDADDIEIFLEIIRKKKFSEKGKKFLEEMLSKIASETLIEALGEPEIIKSQKKIYRGWRIDVLNNIFQENDFEPLYYKEDWTSGTPSKYHPHLLELIVKIKNILFKYGIIPDTTDRSLEKIIKGERLTDTRRDIGKRGKRFNIYEKTLDLWYVRIENEIKKRKTLPNKNTALLEIQKCFHEYYKISGYLSKNPLYRRARFLIFKIGEILLKNRLINNNTEKEVNNFLKYTSSWIYKGIKVDDFKTFLTKGKRSPIESLKKAVKKEIEDKKLLNTRDIEEIHELIEKFKEDIKLFEKFGSLEAILKNKIAAELDEEIISNIISTGTQREDLIINIHIKILELAKKVLKHQSIKALSRLLFNDEFFISQNFWQDRLVSREKNEKIRTIDRHPELYNIFRIKLTMLLWKKKEFEKEGIIITYKNLKKLIKEVNKIIDQFIFNNSFPIPYINPTPRRGFRYFNKEFLIPEYQLIEKLWLAFAIHEDKPNLTFEDIAKLKIVSRYLTSYLSKGDTNIKRRALVKFAEYLVNFYKETSNNKHRNKNIKIAKKIKL